MSIKITETKLDGATAKLQAFPASKLRKRYSAMDISGAIGAAAKYAMDSGEDFYLMPVFGNGSWSLAAKSRSESDICFPGTYFRVTAAREVFKIVATY